MQREKWASEADGRDKKDYRPDMPPLESGDYLIGCLFEVGPTMSGAMGAGPLMFGEIRAWSELTGLSINAVEARVLHSLSIVYLNESHRAEKLGCEPPWKPPDFKPEPSALQMSLRALAADK